MLQALRSGLVGTARCILTAAVLAGIVVPATADDSVYTNLDFDSCEILAEYEGGGFDARCPGYQGLPVFVSEGDARIDVDFGIDSGSFESFTAFNGPGETIEWRIDDAGVAAAILRFFIDVDGRSAQALVVSQVGHKGAPGCVVGVVDASEDQANGIARGIATMARYFDCSTDTAEVVAPAGSMVAQFNAANRLD
ncbi:hypothetical protein GCM10007989_20170 [Devosia pacifica]|uniref:Uncharacterized protein n=1 Tax=Devosia pacifica TaxID=1335967 RepID=A0A918S6V4_9HYPH|nr:hypothetical protein [Devosia pacifica]GHA24467.1 hypothetical protein GCM10007989_20170 [Devosia pacifica]